MNHRQGAVLAVTVAAAAGLIPILASSAAAQAPRPPARSVRGPAARRRPVRDLSTPAKRLVGHWASSRGDHEYFGPADPNTDTGVMTEVDQGGRVTRLRYTIASQVSDGEELSLEIVTFTGDRQGQGHRFVVTYDGQSMTWVIYSGGGFLGPDSLTYVDAKTAPQ